MRFEEEEAIPEEDDRVFDGTPFAPFARTKAELQQERLDLLVRQGRAVRRVVRWILVGGILGAAAVEAFGASLPAWLAALVGSLVGCAGLGLLFFALGAMVGTGRTRFPQTIPADWSSLAVRAQAGLAVGGVMGAGFGAGLRRSFFPEPGFFLQPGRALLGAVAGGVVFFLVALVLRGKKPED